MMAKLIPWFNDERPLVEFFIVKEFGIIEKIIQNFLNLFDLVWSLLKLTDFPNDVRNLVKKVLY